MARRTSLVAAYGAMLALLLGLDTAWGGRAWAALLDPLWRRANALPVFSPSHTAWSTLAQVLAALGDWLGLVVACAAGLAVAAMVARMFAWARVRAGRIDPLEELRRRPWAAHVLAWMPVLLFCVARWPGLHGCFVWLLGEPRSAAAFASIAVRNLAPVLAIALGLAKLGSLVVRELAAPLDEAPPPDARGAGDLVFSAVALTPRTRAAVGAVALASVAMAAWVSSAPLATLQKSPAFLALLAAYVAAAGGVALAFRRASRIAVGIDGIYVGEASRTRFLAYRDLDEVRTAGADLELVRDGRAALRLQLHGEDAGRRDELLARIRGHVERAHADDARGAERLVQALPRRHVARIVDGPASYRDPTLTREQLWELVEGPRTDAPTRAAAAEALATSLDERERERLRVAASHCAEPRLRVALGSLAQDADDAEDDEPATRARGPARRR